MLRQLKSFCWLLCLVAGVSSASAFSLGGPGEAWQVPAIGYNQRFTETLIPYSDPGVAFGWTIWTTPEFSARPMNLGEEYRWNTPTLYYACDQTFLDYFGLRGMQAVDEAVAVFNNLSNVSAYSPSLSEFPLEEMRFNGTATALHLLDVKSAAMECLMERLGLWDPQRWTWCIRDRILPGGLACPLYDYEIIQRNFDPVTWEPTAYVNGTLFTYNIQQGCNPDQGDAVEDLVDPMMTHLSALASAKIIESKRIYYGMYHTGLTRDDVGGLRYLYRANNLNVETTPSGTLSVVTNTLRQVPVITSNLTLFAQQALTNDAPGLSALYPNLLISSTSNYIVAVLTTNLTPYFTNAPWDPLGFPPHLAFVTNKTWSLESRYDHTFANLLTFSNSPAGWVAVPLLNLKEARGRTTAILQTLVATNAPWTPLGLAPVTNIYSKFFRTNEVLGEFFILPTNSCGISLIAPLFTNVYFFTNEITSASNSFSSFSNTNNNGGGGGGGGNTNGGWSGVEYFAQQIVQLATNHGFAAYAVVCETNSIAQREGIEKVNFIRRDFDSVTGRYWYPITNVYTLYAVTNGTLFPQPTATIIPQTIIRVVTQPDITFAAADLAGFPEIETVQRTTPNWGGTNTFSSSVNGPGIIEGSMFFTFNKVGPIHINSAYSSMLDETTALTDFTWASYDGSANAPVVYPSGASIVNLESQLFMQVYPLSLPAGVVDQDYTFSYAVEGTSFSNVFHGSGGQPPYTWSLAPGSSGLPPGLNLDSDGNFYGAPMMPGTYTFTVRMTDLASRFVDRSYVVIVTGP